ncbi:MAG: hypothetical protein HC799_09465 [Limnothrix sp. RL_2_0]|nr:hypothetical protein [Limnothrix sp. RL_2_0]
MPSHPALARILWELEQHQDAPRIKKLLIYTAENRWESDPQILDRYQLGQLVDKLYTQLPSPAHLLEALTTAVSTLSRPAAYSLIATEIVAKLSPLYEDFNEATHIVTIPPPAAPAAKVAAQVIEYVASQLEQHREAIRIKKLLFALCYQRWENDFQVLGQVSFLELLQQVKIRYITKIQFAGTLQHLIASLNNQTIYGQLGDAIVQAIRPLYESTDEGTGLTRPTFPPVAIASPNPPNDDIGNHSSMPRRSKESIFGQSQAHLETDPATAGNPKSRGLAPNATPGIPTNPSVAEASIAAPGETAPSQAPHFMDALDIYHLKLEVMKYANPLRAKILLFSFVHHPFDLTGQDWSMLRSCDFDDLLRHATGKSASVVDLEIQLSAIAQSMLESEEHLQATSAIIQAINLLQNAVRSPL